MKNQAELQGTILRVDLTDGSHHTESLEPYMRQISSAGAASAVKFYTTS